MFEEMARLRFFIPKLFVKCGKPTDKYPYVVMESVSDTEKSVIGKFPEEKYARVFLETVRKNYITAMKAEMIRFIEEEEKKN